MVRLVQVYFLPTLESSSSDECDVGAVGDVRAGGEAAELHARARSVGSHAAGGGPAGTRARAAFRRAARGYRAAPPGPYRGRPVPGGSIRGCAGHNGEPGA